MQTATPKQFLKVGEQQLLDYSITAFRGWADEVIVTVPDLEHARSLPHQDGISYVLGGATRTESVERGLEVVTNEKVFVHDAARPFVTRELLDELSAALDEWECACPVLPVVNSIVVDADGFLAETPSRGDYRDVQTPQAFRTAILREALAARAGEHAHLPELVRREGHKVKHVEGNPWLFKVTYGPSLYMAQYYVENVLPGLEQSNG